MICQAFLFIFDMYCTWRRVLILSFFFSSFIKQQTNKCKKKKNVNQRFLEKLTEMMDLMTRFTLKEGRVVFF